MSNRRIESPDLNSEIELAPSGVVQSIIKSNGLTVGSLSNNSQLHWGDSCLQFTVDTITEDDGINVDDTNLIDISASGYYFGNPDDGFKVEKGLVDDTIDFKINNASALTITPSGIIEESIDIAMLNPATVIALQTPIGAVLTYAGATAPTGFLLCDGSEVSRTTYSSLYSAIGNAWGEGDGSTTFHLPDLRGRTLRGVDNGAGRDPDVLARTASNTGGNVGDNVGSVQDDVIKDHGHSYSLVASGGTSSAGGSTFTGNAGSYSGSTGSSSVPHTHSGTLLTSGVLTAGAGSTPYSFVTGSTSIGAATDTSHTHSISISDHAHEFNYSHSHSVSVGISGSINSVSGATSSSETRMKNANVNFIIKY